MTIRSSEARVQSRALIPDRRTLLQEPAFLFIYRDQLLAEPFDGFVVLEVGFDSFGEFVADLDRPRRLCDDVRRGG